MSKVLTGPALMAFTGESCNLPNLSLREAKAEIDRRLLRGEVRFPGDLAVGESPFFEDLRNYGGRCSDVLSGGYSESPVAIFGDDVRSTELCSELRAHHINCDLYPISDLFGEEPADGDFYERPAVQGEILRIDKRTYRMAIIVDTDGSAAGFSEFPRLPLPERSTHMGEKLKVRELRIERLSDDDCKDIVSCAERLSSEIRRSALHECTVAPDTRTLLYYHYELSGASVYYVCNTGKKEFRGRLIIEHPMRNAANAHHEKSARRLSLNNKAKQEGVAYSYDAWLHAVDRADYKDGTFSLVLESGKSIFLILDRTIASLDEIGRALPKDYLDLFHCSAVRMDDDWQDLRGDGSASASYSASFTAEPQMRYFLEIADAYEAVECFVNGKSVGRQMLPAFWFDLKGGVRPGHNDLMVEVISTGGGSARVSGGIRLIGVGK